MATKWIKWIKTAHRGLRYYEHSTRRHGKKKDRYYSIRFKVGNIDYGYGVGWWSDGIPEEARQNDPNMGFEEYCLSQMKIYKANLKAGSGPKSPKEKRKMAAEKEAQEKVEQARDEIENITFKQYFKDTYYPTAKTHKKKQSYIKEEAHFRLWLEPEMGKKPFKIITHLDLQRIKKKMLDAKKAPRYIQYVMATARQVWNAARRDGLVSGDSPTRSVKIQKFDNRRQRFLSPAEADLLLTKLKEKNVQVYQMALLSLYTGMRASEVFHLTWSCIDIERGLITILDAKSGKGRTAFMTEQVKAMFLDMQNGKNDDLVFPHSKNGVYTEVPTLFRDIVTELKFNDHVSDPRQRVCFHSLRHSFGSWHAEAGTNLYIIKELLGHGSIILTERYSHLTKGTLQNATKNIEQAIARTRQQQAAQDENIVTITG
jgi:integrase